METIEAIMQVVGSKLASAIGMKEKGSLPGVNLLQLKDLQKKFLEVQEFVDGTREELRENFTVCLLLGNHFRSLMHSVDDLLNTLIACEKHFQKIDPMDLLIDKFLSSYYYLMDKITEALGELREILERCRFDGCHTFKLMHERDKIVEWLLSNENSESSANKGNLGIIAEWLLPNENPKSSANKGNLGIIRILGSENTYLAWLAYNHERVKAHFDLSAWVFMHQICDLTNVTRCILQSAHQSQMNIQDLLHSKKYFLVLANICEDNYSVWEALQSVLIVGAPGSKVLLTTNERFEVVSNSWNVQTLKTDYGRLYRLLDGKREDSWNETYYHLPLHLQQCIAYCSVFPKDNPFEKDKLVQQWMAQGYVLPERGRRMEDIGSSYFDYLLSRSFLEVKVKDECEAQTDGFQLFKEMSCSDTRYKMNARIHDLVLSLWENDRIMLKEDFSSLSENTRHLSLLYDHFSESTFDALGLSCNGLRSLLFLRGNQGAYFPDKLSPNYLYLRVLDLSHIKLDRKFTFATGGLRFLCYLDLSESSIGWLDGDFHELQTLRLLRCYSLCKFSMHVNSPVNLRHLQIDTSYSRKLTKMPEKIGELTCLQMLPFFFASREMGYRVGELKKLTELRGELGIFQLENVHSLEEAEEAMLQNKQHLNKLILQWNGGSKQYGLEDVLEGLRPHENLKELEIVSYDGLLFPSWLGNPLYSNLISISLKCCRKCQFLPPLGQLPHLRFLKISSSEEVKHVGYEFYRGDSVKGFLSLEKLEFEGMNKLEKWDDFEQGEFPFLRELDVISCPKLRHLPDLKYLMCLQNLRIEHCSDLESLPREALPTSLESLTVKECPKVKVMPKQRGVKSLMKTYPGDLARNNFSSYIHNRINNIQKELDELREITQNLEINFDDGGTV